MRFLQGIEAISFDDVLLVPQFSDIKSRSEVDLSTDFPVGGDIITLDAPLISSPMDTVTEEKMAVAMAKEGCLSIIHRFCSIKDQERMIGAALDKMNGLPLGAAVGTTGDFDERLAMLISMGVEVICIDVAHGHHQNVKDFFRKFRDEFSEVHFMAGNVATAEAYDELASWGADSIRLSVGSGSCCTTRIVTGHGMPTFAAIIDANMAKNARICEGLRAPLIVADGGIRNSGDAVKCLAAGADLVMLGSVLAGTNETPGKVKLIDGHAVKSYRGMASRNVQEEAGKKGTVEGVSHVVPSKGPVESTLSNFTSGIRSGLSYSGARTIFELQDKAQFVFQTPATASEGLPHILQGVK